MTCHSPSEVAEFLALLGSRVTHVTHRKVVATCPFARWLHSGGEDRRPSFAAISRGDGRWSYKCMGCMESGGSLVRLYWRHVSLGGRPPTGANTIAYAPFGGDGSGERPPAKSLSYGVGGPLVSAPVRRVEWEPGEFGDGEQIEIPRIGKSSESRGYLPTEDDVSRETRREIPGAFLARGFTLETCKEWEVGWDPYSRRVSIPCRDRHGKLVGITRRLVWPYDGVCYRCRADVDGHRCSECGAMLAKYLHTPGRWRSRALFGVHKVVPGSPLIVVEGPLDAIALWQAGVRSPLALFGASPAKEQLSMLEGLARELGVPVVCMGDGDEAGRFMGKQIEENLSKRGIEVIVIDLPDGTDPCDLAMADEPWARSLIDQVQSIARLTERRGVTIDNAATV